MNVGIHQGATMFVKPQNCKRLPVPLAVRDQALQLYIPYIGVSFLAYLQGVSCTRADGGAGEL
jgi:hypothetical protein